MSPRSLPHLALSASAHNRLGLQRTDEEWLARTWADPATRVLLVSGSRLRPLAGQVHWISPAEAPDAGRRVLLGEKDGVAHFALLLAPQDAPGAKEEWLPLRTVLFGVADSAPEQAPFLFHAVGLAEWHFATRFCPRCAGDLVPEQSGHALRCTSCGKQQFPRTDPAVIMAISHGEPGSPDERILLGRQASWPENRWSTLAGFCEPGETLEDAVRREVMEEVGITVGGVDYFGSQPWPLPASLMLAFTGRALDTEIHVDGAEIADARWFTRAELAEEGTSGRVQVPAGVSISASLLQSWYGAELPSSW